MGKEYKPGDRVVIAATVRYSNPTKGLVVLRFPDGSETPPLTWETLAALEDDARSNLYVPAEPPRIEHVSPEEFAQLVDTPPQAD